MLVDENFNLKLCATDINLYIFETNTAKCIYQLLEDIKSGDDENNKQSKDERKLEKALKESSILSIELNKRFFADDDDSIVQVACGREHVLMLTKNKRSVYSFGIGTRGQLGHGTIGNF